MTELDSIINYTLQGRLGRGVRSVGRFVINSTLGIGGLFDVAARINLPRAPTGFGTTLAKWGMHPGPVSGRCRSTGPRHCARVSDWRPTMAHCMPSIPADLYRGDQSWGLGVLNAVDQRANIDFRYYETGSPFEYETIRFLYVRKLLIQDSSLHPPKKRDPNEPAGE